MLIYSTIQLFSNFLATLQAFMCFEFELYPSDGILSKIVVVNFLARSYQISI